MHDEASTTGHDRRPWWEREGLPVPPQWGTDHPDHPDHVEQPRKRKPARALEPTHAERGLFGPTLDTP